MGRLVFALNFELLHLREQLLIANVGNKTQGGSDPCVCNWSDVEQGDDETLTLDERRCMQRRQMLEFRRL
jgi:hypothetical protein